MAVVPMRRVSVYGLKKDRKRVLEALQCWGAVEIKCEDRSGSGFEKLDTGNQQSQLARQIQTAEQALQVLDSYAPEKKSMFSSLEGRKELGWEEYQKRASQADQMLETAARLGQLERGIGEQRAEMLRLQSQLEVLKPWLELEVPMNWKGTKRTGALIGSFPEEKSQEELLKSYTQRLEQRGQGFGDCPIELQVVSQESNQTCVLVHCLKSQERATEEALRSMGFARPSGAGDYLPREKTRELQEAMKRCEQNIQQAEEEIQSLGGERDSLYFLWDYLSLKLERYQVMSQLSQRGRVFWLEGYLPADRLPWLETQLPVYCEAAVEAEDLDPQEEAPVLLRNSGFAEPVESVLETYGMPSKGEADPTSIMAVFYYILFGMMLSDAAYGLLMVLGCGIALRKFRNMEPGMKQTLKMFFYCGISTTVWGVLFGGYFGDAVTVFCSTFLGQEVTIPALWFVPVDEPMKMLMFSLGVGIVHLFSGLGIQAYQLCRQGRYLDALFDVGFWYLLVGGGAGYLLSVPMFAQMAELPFTVGSTGAAVFGIMAAVGAAGILLTAGRGARNPFVWLLKGLYGLYNVTGYLSDILSYSRLLALGLATGVIATVFNKMGSMLGGGVLGFVFFVVVFLIGHSLNLAINLLGAYVHTNRLQFVEFFGKFYDGGGRKFAPFAQHTKYYKIKEDLTNG